MNMTEPATAIEAELEQVTKKKLMENLKAVVTDAEELLKATANQTGERIMAARANPWKAVGITAAVALVLGILVARR